MDLSVTKEALEAWESPADCEWEARSLTGVENKSIRNLESKFDRSRSLGPRREFCIENMR